MREVGGGETEARVTGVLEGDVVAFEDERGVLADDVGVSLFRWLVIRMFSTTPSGWSGKTSPLAELDE